MGQYPSHTCDFVLDVGDCREASCSRLAQTGVLGLRASGLPPIGPRFAVVSLARASARLQLGISACSKTREEGEVLAGTLDPVAVRPQIFDCSF